jgi:hypothetical protein
MQSGLASVAATVQRNGGTAALPGSTLDLALEELGASIEVAAVRHHSGQLSVLNVGSVLIPSSMDSKL